MKGEENETGYWFGIVNIAIRCDICRSCGIDGFRWNTNEDSSAYNIWELCRHSAIMRICTGNCLVVRLKGE